MIEPSPATPDLIEELVEELLEAEAPAALELLQEQARGYARASKAPNTLRGYRTDLADFQAWCQAHDVAWLPASPASIALFEDVEETGDGVVVHLRRSKTDQEAAGEDRAVPVGHTSRPTSSLRRSAAAKLHPETCPVRALRAWQTASGISQGALLRPINRHGQLGPGRLSDRSIARIVQRDCARAGLEPSKYAGHSLRAGLATSAAAGGASERSIMQQGGWKSERIARGYIRKATLFEENAAAYCGL